MVTIFVELILLVAISICSRLDLSQIFRSSGAVDISTEVCELGKSMTTSVFLSYDGMTDPLGQSQVLPYLEGLAASGHRIHIVSAEKSTNSTASEMLLEREFKRAPSLGIQFNITSDAYIIKPLRARNM